MPATCEDMPESTPDETSTSLPRGARGGAARFVTLPLQACAPPLVRIPLRTYIEDIMATQIELIDKYKKELSKLKVKVDDVLLKAVVKSLGPAVYRDDASKISAADAEELERVKQNFMVKRLGLSDGPKLEAVLNKAIDQMGRSNAQKNRAVLYYIITRATKREAALL
jgi:hypothetical protein